MGSSGKISCGISSSFLVSTLEKGCWNLEMLQREATNWDLKLIPYGECPTEAHLFSVSKERCRSYLTLLFKYLVDINNVLSLPKRNGSKIDCWNRSRKRKHIFRAMGDYSLEKAARKKWRILYFSVSEKQKSKPFLSNKSMWTKILTEGLSRWNSAFELCSLSKYYFIWLYFVHFSLGSSLQIILFNSFICTSLQKKKKNPKQNKQKKLDQICRHDRKS